MGAHRCGQRLDGLFGRHRSEFSIEACEIEGDFGTAGWQVTRSQHGKGRFVDADDVVGAGYLEAMAASLDHLEMVSGQLDLTLLNPPWAQDELLTPDRLTVFLDYLPYIPGALIGVRASSWQRIGDFDGDLLSAEDVDFTWRAHRLGVTMGMAPGAVLHYRRPTNAIENFRKARSYGRAHVWLFLRYRSLGQPRLSVRAELYLIKQAMGEMVRREGPWQWRMGWRLGLVEGHLEESIRRRVWYP